MARPEEITRVLLKTAAISDAANALAAKPALAGLFPKVTDFRGAVIPYEATLLKAQTAKLAGAAFQSSLGEEQAALLSKSLGSSAVLAASRFGEEHRRQLSTITARIADLHGARAAIGDISRRWQAPLRAFTDGMERFVAEQRKLDEQTDEFVTAHGWPVPLHLPVRAYRRIVGMATAGRREVNRVMQDGFRPGTRAFSSTAELLLDSPPFESRRPIIEQALRAHRKREWYLVINGLLPLVEGVLVDFAYEGSMAPRRNRPAKAMRQLRGKEGATLAIAVDTLETLLLSTGANMALFGEFEPARYGAPGEPRALNRNAILHGAARRYGSEQNALRLVLLLAVMAEGFELSSWRGGKAARA